jgi:zinc transporter ZupT
MALMVTIIISERLTHVPVPWRNIGVSAIISLATGLAAWGASYLLRGMSAIYPLTGGGAAGTLMFLVMVQIFPASRDARLSCQGRSIDRRRPDTATNKSAS